VGAGILLFVLFGTSANSDVLAHFGGFIGGLFFGSALAMAPARFIQNRYVDLTAFFFFVTISALTWILAVR
jgi:hypothetical protein